MEISKIQYTNYPQNKMQIKRNQENPITSVSSNTSDKVKIPLLILQSNMIPNLTFCGDKKQDLFASIEKNDMHTFKKLIKEDNSLVNAVDTNNISTLGKVVKNKNIEMIKYLAQYSNLDPNIRSKDKGYTPLHYAADVSMRDIYGRDLNVKTIQKNRDCVRELLKIKNINPNIWDNKGFPPFMYGNDNYIKGMIAVNPATDVNLFLYEFIDWLVCYYDRDTDILEEVLKKHDDIDLRVPSTNIKGSFKDIFDFCKNDYYVSRSGSVDKIINMLKEYEYKTKNFYINNDKLKKENFVPEKNIYSTEQITSKFIFLTKSPLNRKKALDLLEWTPLVDFKANNEKALETVIKTGDIEFVKTVFDYIFHKQSQQRVEYDRRRRELFSNMSNKSYEELIKMPVIVNTEDGLRELTNRLEFDPNYKIEGKTLFARACEYDKTYELAKDILAYRDNVDISVIKKPDEQLKAIIEDYKNGGRNSVKMENLRIDLMSRNRAQEALGRAREYVRSEECSAQNTKPNTTNILHALSTSTVDGSTEVMNIAINKGIDIDSRNLYEQTPLMLALRSVKVTNPDSPERKYTLAAVKYLLDKGADISAKDKGGKTVLHYACMSGSPTALRMVLNKEPNILTKDYNGNLPKAFLNNDEIKEVYMEYVKSLI